MKKFQEFILESNDFDDYNDFEETIQWFWMCSWFDKWDRFNWSKAFESFKEPFRYKLAEHALLSYDDFREVEEDIWSMTGVDIDQLVVQTNYVTFSRDDVIDGILEKKYQIFQEAFLGMETFETLEGILDDINNHKKLGLQEKIQLFDRIIHAEHESGKIIDDVDIEELRNEFEHDMRKMK